VSGAYFEAAAGATRYRFFAEAEAYYNPDVTLEDVRDNFGKITDTGNLAQVPEPLDNPMSEIIKRKVPYAPA
jgi:hypothetical protein